MFGLDRGLHETVSGAIMHFLIASQYAGRLDLMGQALREHADREAARSGRTAVRTATAQPAKPVTPVAPAEAAPEREPIAA